MRAMLGDVWVSNGGFALEIAEDMRDGWYRFKHLNGHCHGYVASKCLELRFTRLTIGTPA